MHGFVYVDNENNRILFIESDYKTKCNNVIERIIDAANLVGGAAEVRNLTVANTDKAEIVIKDKHVEIYNSKGLMSLQGYHTIKIETLKEYKLGKVWLIDNADGAVSMMIANHYNPNGVCIDSFKSYSDAVYHLCMRIKTPFNIQIHYKDSKKDKFYRYITSVDNLNKLEVALWSAKEKHSLVVSYMISGEHGTSSLRICTIEKGKVKRNEEYKQDKIYMGSNYKVLMTTVIPHILKVAEQQAKRMGRGVQ